MTAARLFGRKIRWQHGQIHKNPMMPVQPKLWRQKSS